MSITIKSIDLKEFILRIQHVGLYYLMYNDAMEKISLYRQALRGSFVQPRPNFTTYTIRKHINALLH